MTATVARPPAPAQPELSRARLVGRRLVAATVDLMVLVGILGRLGDILLGGVGEWLGRLVGVAGAVALQGRTGVSLGMAIVGLAVARANDDATVPPGIPRSALRHAWLLAPLLAALPSLFFFSGVRDVPAVLLTITSVLFPLLSLAGVGLPPVLLGTVIADPDGRGLHDRWSGTVVRPTPAPRRAGAAVGILVLVWAALTGASWWLGEPDRVDSDRLGGPDTTSATCDVRYDPPFGDDEDRTVELTRGMERVEVRLGPHVARFDDEPFASMDHPSFGWIDEDATSDDLEGLFYELRVQSSGGMSSSGGGLDDGFTRDIEVSGGLAGDLTMACRGDDPDRASSPPAPSAVPNGE